MYDLDDMEKEKEDEAADAIPDFMKHEDEKTDDEQ
jgi:hypothetical protein